MIYGIPAALTLQEIKSDLYEALGLTADSWLCHHRAKAASCKSPGAHFYQSCAESLVCGVRLCNSCHFIYKPEHTGQLRLSEGAGVVRALDVLINNKGEDRAVFVPLCTRTVRNTCILNGNTLGNSIA